MTQVRTYLITYLSTMFNCLKSVRLSESAVKNVIVHVMRLI